MTALTEPVEAVVENTADAAASATSNALVPVKPDRAAELATEFRSRMLAAEATREAYKNMVLDLGRLAAEMREVVPHGDWARYCKRELGKDASTILDYRKIYLGRADIKPESTSIREMLRDIDEAHLPPRHVPDTKQPKRKPNPGRALETSHIQTGTRIGAFTRRDHVHRLDLGWGMPTFSVLNTRNSAAWLPRAAAWRDALSRRHNPAPKKGRPPEPLQPGSDAALAELLCSWFCPTGGRVLDTRPTRPREKAVKFTGREYVKASAGADIDFAIVHLDHETDFDLADILGAMKKNRFFAVVARDAHDFARAVTEFVWRGAKLVADAVLLMPTPERWVEPFIAARCFNRAHKYLLVFAKGEILRAVAACPELRDDDLDEFAHFRPQVEGCSNDDT
jgi:hypothetical protein